MDKLPIDINASYDDSSADASVALHQQHHDAIHAAVNTQVSKGDLFFDLRDQPGVVGDGVYDDSEAMQLALDTASRLGVRAFANGVFRTTRTLRITGDADLSDATVMFYGRSTAVEVGASSTFSIHRTVRLPHVIAAFKTRAGWGEVAGSIGVAIQNSYGLDVSVPHILNFETGLFIAGFGHGTSYCNVTLGHLENNKRNLRFSADVNGWTNQNNFYGGRLSHHSIEGVNVPGTRQILMELTASKINANSFWGTSIESPNVAEYHLDCAGNDNFFVNCRWENTGSGARVIWRVGSAGNIIQHGFGSDSIIETKENGTANWLTSRSGSRLVGDGGIALHSVLSVENTSSSANAAMRVMGAGAQSVNADETTDWAVELSALKLRVKRPSDSHERLALDNVNGRVYVGDGAAATAKYFGLHDDGMGFDGASVCFVTDNTHDLGTPSHRPRYVRAGTGLQTGAFRTTSRPPAATAGVGTCVFDTTLGRPIWSTGSYWVDATGKPV